MEQLIYNTVHVSKNIDTEIQYGRAVGSEVGGAAEESFGFPLCLQSAWTPLDILA